MPAATSKVTVIYACIGLVLLGYLFFWPTDVDPVSWDSPQNPGFVIPFAPNNYLKDIERIPTTHGNGPEDIAVDSLGRIYGGLENGKIVRYQSNGQFPDIFADTEGRPLGLHFDARQNLIVADGVKGTIVY